MGDDDDQNDPRKTIRGFASPQPDDERRPVFADETEVDHSPPSLTESGELYLPPGTTTRPLHDETPLVEIEVVHQHGPAPRMDTPPHTVEVWTQNRIYTCDAQLNCIVVTDRASGKADPGHPFLGFRLVGGQHRDGETFEISYPFPRPGTEAVFEHPRGARGNFSRTSTVNRVVLRLNVVTVAPKSLVPTWSAITHSELKRET